jgi:hypothetical protein
VSIRRFVWVLAAVVCVFVATLFFMPLSLRTLITNPLFAIGFGAPLVLYISSLPRIEESFGTFLLGMVLSFFVGLLAGVSSFPQWIIGFGLASTIVLAVRGSWLFLLPSLIALFFTLEVSLFLDIISTFPRVTYDALLYAADGALAGPISFRVGQFFASEPLIGAICTAIYLAPPPGLIYVYALEAKSKTPPRVDIVTTLVAMGAAGYALYFIVPACGPRFAFFGFPDHFPEEVADLVQSPHGPRNAMPSLHMASALIAYAHSRRFGRIAIIASVIFVIGTFFGTMGTGEHYFVDLVVAIPFTAMMFALLQQRWRRAIEPAILLFAWLFLLRFGVLQPLVLWPMLILSIVCARNLHQNAPA